MLPSKRVLVSVGEKVQQVQIFSHYEFDFKYGIIYLIL